MQSKHATDISTNSFRDYTLSTGIRPGVQRRGHEGSWTP